MQIQDFSVYEAIKLLDYYILLTNNKEQLYISKKENNIVIFNNNVKTILSKNDFTTNFLEVRFIIYKELVDDVEIDTEYRKLRQ